MSLPPLLNWSGNKRSLLASQLRLTLLCLAMSLLSPAWAFDSDDPIWPALKQTYFGDRHIRGQADDLLTIEAPKRAEDAAIVPVSIKSLIPQNRDHHITALHLFIDNNPMPHAATFHLSPSLKQVNLATRVRVDSYTPMRVIAEMNDGSLHMIKTFVKASGGCSAPAGKDHSAALARLGKMQIRMRQATVGKATPVQVIVSHPNNSGLQMDQVTRGYIPAHYVKTMAISYNGEALIKMEAGISISEDPSLRFVFTPQQTGELSAEVTDSKNQQFQQQKQL
jgi:sulfur-oxidizing protein SoxY